MVASLCQSHLLGLVWERTHPFQAGLLQQQGVGRQETHGDGTQMVQNGAATRFSSAHVTCAGFVSGEIGVAQVKYLSLQDSSI